MTKGNDDPDAVLGNAADGTDVDSMFASDSAVTAGDNITLITGDEDGFFAASISGAGALDLSGGALSDGRSNLKV